MDGLNITTSSVALVGVLLECTQHPPYFLHGCNYAHTKAQPYEIHTRVSVSTVRFLVVEPRGCGAVIISAAVPH